MAPRKSTTAAKSPVTARKAAAKKAAPRKAVKAAVAAVADVTGVDLFNSFMTDLRKLVDLYLTPIGTTTPADDVDDEDDDEPDTEDVDTGADEGDEDEHDAQAERRAELESMSIAALRKIAIATNEFEVADIKAEKDKTVLIDGILDVEFSDEDEDDEDDEDDDDDADDTEEEEEDEDDDEDEDEDDEDEEQDGPKHDRDALMGMNLRELKTLAIKTYDIDAAEVKSADKDTIIDLILEPEDDEDDDDDADDDDDVWTEAELRAMPIASVRGIAKEAGLKVVKGATMNDLVKLICE